MGCHSCEGSCVEPERSVGLEDVGLVSRHGAPGTRASRAEGAMVLAARAAGAGSVLPGQLVLTAGQ